MSHGITRTVTVDDCNLFQVDINSCLYSFHTQDNIAETPSMYDLVKRKHDQTPTPEKRSKRKDTRRCQEDEQPDDSDEEDEEEEDDDEDEEDEDDDDDDDDDDGEEEGEGEKDYKGYQLRKSRPIPNRYTAPPLKSSSKGTWFQNIMSSFYHLFQSVFFKKFCQILK